MQPRQASLLWAIAAAPAQTRRRAAEVFRAAAAEELAALWRCWPFWARADQLPPAGDWRTWLLLGGRGSGKTRAGAEWVRAEAESGRRGRFALIAPALADVREVMIEGPSGLRAIAAPHAAPRFEPSRRRLLWPNGAVAYGFSAEDPDALRGPQFDGAWLDEFAAWRDAGRAYDMLQFGLRVGRRPRAVVTTTPRPVPAVRRLIDAAGTAVTRALSLSNAANLAPEFLSAVRESYQGTQLGRQELDGELLDALDRGLWSRALIDQVIDPEPPPLERIVVAVDPPAGEGEKADACGIVVAGALDVDGVRCVWVLADRTVQGASPADWSLHVVRTAREFGADRIVAEVNQGGAMVRALLKIAGSDVPVTEVRASRGKKERAGPVIALYERGRVFHAGRFPALEDQMCAFGSPDFGAGSPDRLDALVWAVTALAIVGQDAPRARML